MQIVDQNDLVKKFDFSSLITEQDNQEACAIIKGIIDSGNYFKNSPRYQTKENLLSRKESVWLKYRMSFLTSVFMYIGREVKVANVQSWSFMTNLDGAEDRDKLWHHHHHKPNTNMLSGIWYLHIPDDIADKNTAGTEIAPNGPESDGKYYVKPTVGNWLIYPSRVWHRPGIVQSNNYRFVLAADVEYII